MPPRVRSAVAPTLIATALMVPLLGAFQDPVGEAAGEAGEAADELTPLAKQMEVVEQGLRKLRRSVRDPERNAESIELLAGMQRAALESKSQRPVMTERVPEAERDAFLADYRKGMIALLEGLLAIEKSLLDGDNRAAREHTKRVAEMEDSGHDKFVDDE